MAFTVGNDFGKYHIERKIGAGGMASVYQAYQSRLDRRVAIKVMHPNIAQQGDFLARFEREARIVAKLDHPNIVPIYDFNEEDHQPYLVMKYVDGQTLKQMQTNAPVSHQQIITLMQPIADALDYAHQQSILHRDIKPSNILIDERGIPYLTDFGLARMAQAGESTMSADVMLGTPHYISPEQAQGNQDLDARTDVYSLGIVQYELLAGTVPFMGDTSYAIIHNQIYTPAPPIRRFKPDLPEAVEFVLSKALEKNRDDRYQTPEALMDDFSRALQGDAVTVPPRFVRTDNASDDSIVHPDGKQRPSPPVPPAPPKAGVVQDLRESLREARDDIRSSLKDAGRDIRESFQEVRSDVRESIWGGDHSRKAKNDDEDLTEEKRIRRDVEKRIAERNDFYTHLGIYIAVNAMLWMIFLLTGSDHPWPLYPMFGWGIGIVAHYIEYRNEYGAGRLRREEMIEEEIARERHRREAMVGKRKNDEYFVDDVRLTEDGELTDSFVDDYYADEQDYQGGRR